MENIQNVVPGTNPVPDEDAARAAYLIDLLKQVDACPEIVQGNPSSDGYHYLTDGEEDKLHILLQDVVAAANATLITPEGLCLWENHSRLNNAGFRIFCGERDSFGWLTGCITTTKGIIVYG